MQWDETGGPRSEDCDGYAPWAFMGTDRFERCPQFLWHQAVQPDDYYEQARLWDLPYSHDDFIDPNQGFGTGAE